MSLTYTYLILIEVEKDLRKTRLFTSYLIPDTEITEVERVVLNNMQISGHLDLSPYAKPSNQMRAIHYAMILYLFESTKGYKDGDFILDRKKNYESFYAQEFTDVGKWVKYKRDTNTNVRLHTEISHIYELVNDTYED